jgi:two-component system chemotaxis sensor kinase CheA
MQGKDKLIELLNTAASQVTMLNPADLSGLSQLQEAVDQIKSVAAGMDGAAAEARATIGDNATLALQILNEIGQSGKEDAAKSIGSVTKAIIEIQEMVEKGLSPAGAVTVLAVEEKRTDAGVISEEDLPLVMDFLAEAQEHVETGEKALLVIEKNTADKEAINQVFRSFHTIKGMAGFLNLTAIGSLAHAAENILDMARKDKLVLSGLIADAILESVDMMKRMIASLKDAAETGKPAVGQDGLDAMLLKLKGIAEGKSEPILAGESAAKTAAPSVVEQNAPVAPQAAASSAAVPQSGSASSATTSNLPPKTATSDEKIKVSTERLDLLVNMVGELVTAQLMLAEGVNSGNGTAVDLSRKVAHQGKIVRELQELSMSMRMVPISGVFQKMTRLVRDLAHKAGKNVELVTTGEDTELDRNIVDNVSDPLVHMIRNSVDHGLEMPEGRIKAGKNPCGRIELRAFHQAGHIVVEIEDDGRGLNKERILRKAIDSGIVVAGAELSEDEIFKLIFHAGLSTAEKVTSVSGRGVGMDVVKKNVEALRGRVDIKSTLGKGTTFTVRLPLTLAVIEGQVVRVGNERYIVPINSIIRSLRPEANQISSVEERGEMALIRGELLPLVRLHRLFDVPAAEQDPAKALMMIIEEDGRKCGLMVDDLLGQQQVVIKTLGDGIGKVAGVSGGAIMGDGRVCLILDTAGLMCAR